MARRDGHTKTIMALSGKTKPSWHWRIIVTLLLFFSPPAFSQSGVLQQVRIVNAEPAHHIIISFGTRMNYLRHFPYAVGTVLQIQLRADQLVDLEPLTSATSSRIDTRRRESLAPATRLDEPLSFVTYEGNVPGGPYLTVRFKWAVSFTVQEGSDGRSIEIRAERYRTQLSTQLYGENKISGDPQLDRAMSDALKALGADDNARAIVLLDRLLKMPPHAYTQQAKELMGVARDRRGELERARIEYLEFLRLYPGTPAARRVNERLSDLEMRRNETPPSFATPAPEAQTIAAEPAAGVPAVSGQWSQNYLHDNTDLADNTTIKSTTLSSSFNSTLRADTERFSYLGFTDMVQTHSLGHDAKERPAINALYLQVNQKNAGHSATLGRQYNSESGLLGRYDGLTLDLKADAGYRISGTVAHPAEPLPDTAQAERLGYGIAWRSDALFRALQSSVYYGEQTIEGLRDRHAIGSNLRYSGDVYSMNASVDFDLSFNAFNVLTLGTGRRIGSTDRMDLTYDQRVAPQWLLSSALLNEQIDDFGDLTAQVPRTEIFNKAKQLPIVTRRLTLSLVKLLGTSTWLFADAYVVTSDARDAVNMLTNLSTYAALPAYGPEYFYSAQTITSDFWFPGNAQTFGVRWSTGAHRDTQMLLARADASIAERWRVGPRVQIDRSHAWSDDSVELKPSIGCKLEYRFGERVRLDGDLTYEQATTQGINPSGGYSRFALYFGYRVEF